MTFAVPVSLRFAVDADVAASAKVAFQTADGGWRPVPITSRQAGLTVETTHFSTWARMTGVRLSPTQANVAPGDVLSLQLEVCVELPNGCIASEDDACELYCYGQGQIVVPDVHWAVNGVEWGNDTVGVIVWGDATGRGKFQAPDRAPSPKTVQVSATCDEGCHVGSGRIIVLSNVTIGAQEGYTGTVTSREVTVAPPDTVTTTTSATVDADADAKADADVLNVRCFSRGCGRRAGRPRPARASRRAVCTPGSETLAPASALALASAVLTFDSFVTIQTIRSKGSCA
jgi:hypothetical protein